MPLYDYNCVNCKELKLDVFHKMSENPVVKCSKCGKPMTRTLMNCDKRDWFRPHWNENIDIKPIYVESKEHYKRLCKERGLVARCLM